MPAFNVFKLPDVIDDDMAAILDPLGNATHTALSFDLVGEDVLITGAGPIGIMAVAIARYAGARHVVITADTAATVTAPANFSLNNLWFLIAALIIEIPWSLTLLKSVAWVNR